MMTSKWVSYGRCWRLALGGWLLAVGSANGQEASPSPSSPLTAREVTTQVGVGSTNILDTYLSQEKFSGLGLSFLTTAELRKDGRLWATLKEHELNFVSADDRSGIREELQGDYTFLLGRLRQWHLGAWCLQAGGMVAANIGVIYNTANSNNPAQGRFSLQFMPTGAASYTFPLLHRRCRLRYELQLPLAGVMFSPNYGQSYYEIFSLGNYDHNVVPVTFIATPNLRQQLSFDCPVSRYLTMRIGYLGHYQQARVNNLKSHVYHHRVMIGVVRNFTITRTP